MQHRTPSIIILALAAILLTMCSATAQASSLDTNTGTNWKRHTAFDGQVRRIMEGPRFVYIWAHQQLYSKGTGTRGQYSTPHGTVLYIDKENSTMKVRALADDFPTSGLDASCVDYNPDLGYLVMAYTNGVIDILTDAGQVHTIRDFDGLNGRLTINPRNISFDKVTGDAWIATSNGFVRIDGTTYTATDAADWRRNVNSICRVGDRVVAIIGNSVYEAPVTADLSTPGNLTQHSGLATRIHGVMPMSANTFAALTDGKNISMVRIEQSGDVTVSTVVTDTGFSGQLIAPGSDGKGNLVTRNYTNLNYYVNDEFENNFIPTRDGYLALSKTHIYQLRYNSAKNQIESTQRKFSTTYVDALARQTGSYDCENFWFYDFRKGFYCEKASGTGDSTAWSTGASRIPWLGPVSMQNAQLRYSPTKGVICMSRTSTMFSVAEVSPIPLLMSGYKNGSWTNYSPIYSTPDFCNSNNTAKSKFESTKNGDYAYPIRHANNFIVDPLNPDYVIVGSMFSGVVAMNLDDITGQIMHFTYEQDSNYKDYPGFAAVMAGNTLGCPALYVCGTDKEGNLWIYFPDTLNSSGSGCGINAYYWTSSDRADAYAAQDISQSATWHKTFFPHEPLMEFSGRLALGLALRNPSSLNRLIFYPRITIKDNRHSLITINHNGTPDDGSDDETNLIKNFATPTGLLRNEGYVNFMVEDPVSGDIIAPVASNLVRFNLNTPIANNTIEAEIISLVNRDGSMTPVAQNQKIHAISFDEYNRMWIGTSNDGVYGISADRKELIAHYTTGNSPLLSNCINDICWNPDTQELFIATAGGIMSMNPYTPNAGNGPESPIVEPASVTPDYAGTVRLHKIPAGASIIVEDENGKQITSLAQPVNGLVVWDICDSDGNQVPSGIYTFHDLSGAMDDMQVTVLR